MGAKTIENLFDLMSLVIKAEYESSALDEIEKRLGKIFGTEEVSFKKKSFFIDAEKNENTRIIPIYIKGKEYGFYEIKNVTNAFADLIIDGISTILTEMYINILERLPEHSSGEIDLLTKVYSRNAFEIFKQSFDLKQYGVVGCVFIDINGMNEINQKSGHKFGDMVISSVACLLKEIFIQGKIFRIGGDEFVVIDTNIDENIFEKLINDLHDRSENIGISISVGASVGNNIQNIDEFITSADISMYEHKKEFYQNKGECMRKKYRTSSI